MWIYLIVGVILLALDQGSKTWVQFNVSPHELTPILPNLIDLTYVQNKGVSFSFMADWPTAIRLPLLIGVSVLAVVGMLYYCVRYWDEMDAYLRWAFVMIVPGAAGNLIDRALYGAVTDFMHFRWYEMSFFVNNLADCFISVGVVLFMISTYLEHQESKKAT